MNAGLLTYDAEMQRAAARLRYEQHTRDLEEWEQDILAPRVAPRRLPQRPRASWLRSLLWLVKRA